MRKTLLKLKFLAVIFVMALFANSLMGQTIPYSFANNSSFADANIYVAVVGIQNGAHVWLDCRTSAVLPMNSSYNTVTGPTIGGNTGPGGNSKYAACFTRLSEVPNKIVNIPRIEGCRIFISFNSQLFLYFFGSTGAPSGYAAPNLANSTDPNQGIRYEIIELTNAANGLWTNTTRVDSYQYPMGLEVWGANSFYKKVGELKTHDQIIAQWRSQAPSTFQVCLDANNVIHFPSKVSSFPTNYFNAYVDQIWAKYASGDLIFNAGDAGTWRGRTSGNVFTFTRTSDGQVATITNKPTNLECMEGSGVLAAGGQWDKVVQAQVCAAINRHAINLNAATGTTQDWSNAANYYVTDPYNWYCKFWHQTDISFNGLTYAFCYDDVFDKSSTINCPSPTSVKVTIGGFAGQTTTQSPYAGVIAIPGTVQMENYDNGGQGVAYSDVDVANKGGAYRADGVDIEGCSEGGQNICWSENAEWLEYTVNVATAGSYTMNVRVASPIGGSCHVEFNGANVSGAIAVPNTGGWQNWQTVTKTVTLSAGQQIMRFFIDTKEFNTNYISFTSGTTTVPVTGVTVSPTSASNAAGTTRQLTATVNPSNATDKTVTWTSSNTAVATVNSSGLVTAVSAGTATITVRTNNGGFTATCAITVTGGTTTGTDITNLGGTVSAQYTDSPTNEGIGNLIDNNSNTKYLTFHNLAWVQYQSPSPYVVTSYTITSANDAPERDPLSWNLQGSNNGTTWTALDTRSGIDFPNRLQKLTFTFSNTAAFTYYRFNMNNNSGTILQLAEIELFGTATSTIFSTTIQAESYSSMSGVQIETTTDAGGGSNVGYIEANDWMAYPAVNIPAAGTYTIEYRVASQSGGGNLQFELAGGSPVYGTLAVPSTGGWQTWTTIKHTVTLSAGSQSFAIKALAGGWNINWFAITQGLKSAGDDAVVEEEPVSAEILLYPIPVKNTLYISSGSEIKEILITDMLGKVIYRNAKVVDTETQIDVNDLTSGVYFISIVREGSIVAKQFIKN